MKIPENKKGTQNSTAFDELFTLTRKIEHLFLVRRKVLPALLQSIRRRAIMPAILQIQMKGEENNMSENFKKLHEDVCFSRANGKIIWQPRIQCWYDDKIFLDGKLPGKYEGMSKVELYKDLGCSARVYEYNDCFYPVYDKSIQLTTQRNGNLTEFRFKTPVGEVNRILEKTPSTWAELVKKEWVCSEEDLKVFSYIEQGTNWAFSQEVFDRVNTEWGNLGAPTVFIPRVSMQRLYIDLMGVENGVYAVYDYPETVESYFKDLRECHHRLIDVINDSPINIINFGDNIHSGTLSPNLFEEYVLEEYQDRCERLHKAGKFICAHFDGDNRGLMKFYKQTGLDGIEAITPKPQGDVELEEVKENLGNMFLLDGIPAVYFDEIYPEEVLAECTERIIKLFAPNLILGISDEISSTGDIDRIRLVGKIVDDYNKKISAAE